MSNYNMNDTLSHTPNNHMIPDLPQNITIMNDTYISYNFYKLWPPTNHITNMIDTYIYTYIHTHITSHADHYL